MTPRISSRLYVFLACLGFVLLGVLFIPYNGIEADEVLFVRLIFGHVPGDFRIRVFNRIIPLMLMDYVGALKSWLYWPIFLIAKPSPLSLRLPMLLVGALTIWLFYRLLLLLAGPRAALAGCLLLATDTTFLLTTEFDWGPVVIQHLMLVLASLWLLQFSRGEKSSSLFGGFFALGLGLWDKALFIWVLGGLGVAAAIVFPKEIMRRTTAKNVSIALAGFILGVWPLVVFNARHHWPTIHATSFSTENIGQKVEILKRTLNGSSLFGYMVNESSSPYRREPAGWMEKVSTRIATFTGEHQQSLLLPVLLIVLCMGPLWKLAVRPLLFVVIFMAVTWLQMAMTRDAGVGVHHAILLWPAPQLAIAVTLAKMSQLLGRWGAVAFRVVILVLCAANLLLTNQYLSQFIRFGPAPTWTDGIYALSHSLGTTQEVVVMDWDILEQLMFLRGSDTNLQVGYSIAPHDPPLEKLANLLGNEQTVFVNHLPESQFFPEANRRLEAVALERGYRKNVRTVTDSLGRVVYEVYQFEKDQ